MTELAWRKSTRSEKYNCVEVAVTPGEAFVRDSKDRDGGHLGVPMGRWRSFLSQVRAGRFDA